MTASVRFEFRLPRDDKQRIEAAAALAHETASDFARVAVLGRVEEILRRQENTFVSADFFQTLLDELDKAPVENEALARAAQQSRGFLEYGDRAA